MPSLIRIPVVAPRRDDAHYNRCFRLTRNGTGAPGQNNGSHMEHIHIQRYVDRFREENPRCGHGYRERHHSELGPYAVYAAAEKQYHPHVARHRQGRDARKVLGARARLVYDGIPLHEEPVQTDCACGAIQRCDGPMAAAV